MSNVKIIAERPDIVAIADAVRNKTGATNEMTIGGIINGINNLSTKPTLQEKTITPTTSSQSAVPDSGYDGLSKVTVNAIPTATQATPSITVSSSGLITAKSLQLTGYVTGGTKQVTKQLTTQSAKTITPSTSSQTAVASDRYTTGAITVKGDANLVASNIKSGVSIFGVSGTYEGSGGSGSVSSASVTFTISEGMQPMTPVGADIYFTTPSLTTEYIFLATLGESITKTVAVGTIISIFYIYDATGMTSCSGDVNMLNKWSVQGQGLVTYEVIGTSNSSISISLE